MPSLLEMLTGAVYGRDSDNPYIGPTNHALGNVAQNMLTLPQRGFQSSEAMRQGYGYDPQPIMEAAMMAAPGTPGLLPTIGRQEYYTNLYNQARQRLIEFKKAQTATAKTVDATALPAAPDAARAIGYDTPAFHGTPGFSGSKVEFPSNPEFASTASPGLASLYANGNAQGSSILPLMLNTSKYHVVDAGRQPWQAAMPRATREAQELGAPGVTVHNVIDEPATTRFLGPKTVHITFPEGANTIRSRFAQFDPHRVGENNLLASLAAVAGAGSSLPMFMPRPNQ